MANPNCFLTDIDRYLFGNGTHYEIYHKLGAHETTCDGQMGFHFAVWAPHASCVSVVGDFNNWDTSANPMTLLETSGIYETFIPEVYSGDIYKFAITTETGKVLFKADPYARSAEYRPDTASVTCSSKPFVWKDSKWLEQRKEQDFHQMPMSIYEVHLGSWKKSVRDEKNGFYTYKEAAHELAEYVKDMGYTHVELIGIAEHPYDGSWGYQVSGYFAPTSRYGTPDEFQYFVNYLHKKGIGIILDWVPAHFPRDAHGLSYFDGEALYEYADPRKGEHPDWGTNVFDYSKHEVSNFLISNALYWIKEFHIDALRVDAVASMLYLDYGRNHGEWIPNEHGGNENLEAIEFFRHLNSQVRAQGAGAIVIAEESTAWPSVTKSPEDSGLGFHFKWNMGWMHDFLEYMKMDPYFRKFNHNKMTFGLTYFTSENFILVLSHDEVVHLKNSMINKMPGIYEDKFANLKAGYAFMMGHPGKKLLFMGQDFGQYHEWNEEVALDWHLTREDEHADLQNFVKDLLHIYRKYPAMYQLDTSWDGFQWMNANDSNNSIFSFVRYEKASKKNLLFIINFTPVERSVYRLGVPKKGKYILLLNETHGRYKTSDKPPVWKAEKIPWDDQSYSIEVSLASYGIMILRF